MTPKADLSHRATTPRFETALLVVHGESPVAMEVLRFTFRSCLWLWELRTTVVAQRGATFHFLTLNFVFFPLNTGLKGAEIESIHQDSRANTCLSGL